LLSTKRPSGRFVFGRERDIFRNHVYVTRGKPVKAIVAAVILLLAIPPAITAAAEPAPAQAKPAPHRLHKKDPCADKARAAAAKKQRPASPPRAKH
jgi:hypothetical protein